MLTPVAFAVVFASLVCGRENSEWPALTPEYYDHAADRAFQMKGAYFRGEFVSAEADDGRKGGEFRLRRTFTLSKPVARAWLQAIADNRAVFALNGKEALRASFLHATMENNTALAEVTDRLVAGENRLEASYSIRGGSVYRGGAVAELFVRYADGTFERVETDSAWEGSADGTTWTKVVTSPAPPYPPRSARRCHYRDFEHPQACLAGNVSAEVRQGELFKVAFDFEGAAPADEFTVRLELVRDGRTYWDRELWLGPANVKRAAGNRWRLEFDAEMSHLVHPGAYRLVLASNSIFVSSGSFAADLKVAAGEPDARFSKPVRAEMKPVAGYPEIHLDGKPLPLLLGHGFWRLRPDLEPKISDMPFSVVTVYIEYDMWHWKDGVYDFSVFDRLAEKYRRNNPSAYFFWDLTVYPPPDFAKRHPEEMSADETGDCESVQRFSYSYASKRAIDEMKEMVERAIRYVEASPWANRVIGYRVNSGVTIEWLGWESKPGRARDFSDVNRRAFAEYAARHYPELADPHVPTFAERTALDAPNDVLWDRTKHLNAIAYQRYNSWIIARRVVQMCSHAKDVLGELGRTKLVGTYYGYTCYLNGNGHSVYRGHYELADLLERGRGKIDFLMSPHGYGQRGLGETCGDMKPFATLAAHGIKPLVEDDTRTTGCLRPLWNGQPPTHWLSQQLLRRNGAVQLCHCTSPYFYALVTGLDLDVPEFAAVGRALKPALDYRISRAVPRKAEVALVFSERSVTALPELWKEEGETTGGSTRHYQADGTVYSGGRSLPPFHGEVFNDYATKFARAGVPVDYVLAEDLKRNPGDYRLYVFCNLFDYDDETLAAVRRLRQRGVSLHWIYAPGYMKDNSLAAMSELTGLSFREAGSGRMARTFEVVGTPAADVRNSSFSPDWRLEIDDIRRICAKAGCHVYCDSEDPIEANGAFVTLHAYSAGRKTIRLPHRVGAVVDVYNRRVVARNADSFEFDAPLHSSWLFCCADDAEAVLSDKGGK